MAASQLQVAIENNLKHVADSIVEAWITLALLQALQSAVVAGGASEESKARCADEFYRATFVSLYAQLGAIIDESDGVLSLPRLLPRLRTAWAANPELLAEVHAVEHELAASETATKVKAWRNKVIAHRTSKTHDKAFYEANKVVLGELDEFLEALQDWLNRLAVNATGSFYTLKGAIPSLGHDVGVLFGVDAVET